MPGGKQRDLLRAGGAALVEFALVLPMLLILIANVVNFGGFFFDWITVENAARSGVQYYVLADTSVNAPPQQADPVTQVAPLIDNDMLSLLKSTKYSGQVCLKKPSGPGIPGVKVPPPNCTPIGLAGATFPAAPPDDPSNEANLYNLAWVDVTYTYQPFIPLGFRFPGLKLYVTLPSNLTIHRRAIMRVI